MPTVQIVLQNEAYARALGALLAREGVYEISNVAEPDFGRDGVIVADRGALERYPALIQQPARLVLIAPNDPKWMGELWEHEIRSVVFESDPPSTAVLAILGLELGKAAAPGKNGRRLVLINGGAGAPTTAQISAKQPA
jgi:hypothetical protein